MATRKMISSSFFVIQNSSQLQGTVMGVFLVALGVLTAYLTYYVSKFLFYALCVFALLITVCTAAKAADWSKPGHNPYVLSVPDAVDNYKDIPKETRVKLKQMMQPPHKPTDTVLIGTNTITGKKEYSGLRDMHWGKARTFTAGAVTRNMWASQDKQRAFVYCVEAYCIAVPFICRNVARVDVLHVEEIKNEPVVTVTAESETFEQVLNKEEGVNKIEIGEYGYDTRQFSSEQFVPSYVYNHDPNFMNKPLVFIAPPIPEPSTYALMCAGIFGLMAYAKRRQSI